MAEPLPRQGVRIVPLAFMAASYASFNLRRAINRALDEKRIPPLAKDLDRDLTDRLMGLHTKLACLPITIDRLLRNWRAVRDNALTRNRDLDGYALDGTRQESRELVVDTETLFSALKSAYDVGRRLAKLVGRRILQLPNQIIESELAAVPGLSASQRELLEDVRGEFVHAAAPWFEVVIPDEGDPDLAILLTHDPDYEAGEGYVLLSAVEQLIGAVATYLNALEARFADLVNKHGRSGEAKDANTH